MPATQVFLEEQTVFFVGGRGNKSGRIADAGGCTKSWWDNEVAANGVAAAMIKLMGTNGEPIVNMGTATYTTVDERITKADVGKDVEVGMVAYIIKDGGSGSVNTGRYLITDTDASGWIECLGITGTDCTVTVIVGGAFDELNNAVDETSASIYSVWIHTNLVETLTAAITITAGGNNVTNTFKRILGFNTVPGDMNRGEAYYESPFEMLLAGSIDLTKTVRFDANGGAFENISITADNIIIENIYLYNNDDLLSAIMFVGIPQNIVFRNCRFTDTKHVFLIAVDSLLFDSCFSKDLDWNHFASRGSNNVFLNCISDVNVDANWLTVVSIDGTQVIGCLMLNGAMGIRVLGNTVLAMNNTFYDQTLYGIFLDNAKTAVAFNNIFVLYPGAIALRILTAGSFINDYNCFIESDGTPLTVGLHSGGYETPVLGEHSITVDPLFISAANNDFRLKPISPCLNTGKSDYTGYMNMGAWNRISRIRR